MQMVNDVSREKVPLSNINKVRAVASEYLQECAESGTLPTVSGCAARLGVGRSALYRYREYNPDSDFARWLEDFSGTCGELMIMASMEGAINPVPAIFFTKTRMGWRESPVEIELRANNPIGGTVDEDELKRRIAADVVIDNYGEE